jgi:hypothetical protein
VRGESCSFVFSSAARIVPFGAEPAGGIYICDEVLFRGAGGGRLSEKMPCIVSYRIVSALSTCRGEVGG